MKKYTNNNNKPIETLCLCRVSSDKQAKKETIVSQKQLCLNYAHQNGFIIDTFFYEEAVSGWKGKRPGLLEMCDYMTATHKNKRFRVLFYDISRVARNMLTFSRFEDLVQRYGVEWRTVVNGTYKNTAIDRFMWRLDAINAQRFSEELSEKTRNAMRSLMTLGYYPLNPPLGLKRQKDEHNKVILIPDEPRANLIRQAFEKYASGELATKHAVADFLNSFDVWSGRKISDTQANDILHNPVYTGFFAYERWDIPLQEWKIVHLIPQELFLAVQARLEKSGHQPYKSNIDDDFPLRHEIVCEHCGHPLTGYFAKSGTKGHLHPYYRCHNKECPFHTHSIQRQCVENAFVAKLSSLNVSDDFLNLCCAMVERVEKNREKEQESKKQDILNKIRATTENIKSMSLLVAQATQNHDDDLKPIYESQIKEMNKQKQELQNQIDTINKTSAKEKFLTAIKRSRDFFKRPEKLWFCGTTSQKKRLVRLIFTSKPAFNRETGFLTAPTPQIFNENTAQMDGESNLAAQDFTNLNRLIEETINIAENLLDVDLVLYWQHRTDNSEQSDNL